MAKPKQKTFEESLARLEEIIDEIESGAALEDSVKLYKEGTALAAALNGTLNAYETAVTELMQTAKGEFVEKPFTPAP